MKKRPFIWLRVNQSIKSDWFADFNKRMPGNAGLAMTLYAMEKNGPEIIQEIHSKWKIPMALIVSDKSELQYKVPDFFQESIISPGAKNIKHLEIKPNYIPCYSIVVPKKQGLDIKRLLSELSEYFEFKVFFYSKEAIVAFYPENEKIMAELLKNMVKLGITSFMVNYSKKNIEALQHCLIDDRIGINTDTADKPKILKEWRARIDMLDELLIESIARRLEIVKEMGAYKTKHNLPLFEAERWGKILMSRCKNAILKNVDQELINEIFVAIHLAGLKKMLEE
jgi:chorismate mutase